MHLFTVTLYFVALATPVVPSVLASDSAAVNVVDFSPLSDPPAVEAPWGVDKRESLNHLLHATQRHHKRGNGKGSKGKTSTPGAGPSSNSGVAHTGSTAQASGSTAPPVADDGWQQATPPYNVNIQFAGHLLRNYPKVQTAVLNLVEDHMRKNSRTIKQQKAVNVVVQT
ncbi:hypothetical protein K474DRAFT_421067 [Panus rudis PR-1116 ss-1]|nr:hypothetical protein K474DRAFT_421067 [Panus rudis PR-1116 ss-1]